MLCPDCGKEMEEGYLYANAPVLWSAEPRKRTLLRGEGDVTVFGNRDLFQKKIPAARICRACRRVLVEY